MDPMPTMDALQGKQYNEVAQTVCILQNHTVPRDPGVYNYPECSLCFCKPANLFKWKLDKSARLTAYSLSKTEHHRHASILESIPVIFSFCPIHLYQPNICYTGHGDAQYEVARFFVDLLNIDDHQLVMSYLDTWRTDHGRMLKIAFSQPDHSSIWPKGSRWTLDRYRHAIRYIRAHAVDFDLDPQSDSKFQEYSTRLIHFWMNVQNPAVPSPHCPQYDWSSRQWRVPEALFQCPMVLTNSQAMLQHAAVVDATDARSSQMAEEWMRVAFPGEVRGNQTPHNSALRRHERSSEVNSTQEDWSDFI